MARTNREFCMLAQDFVPTKHRSAGMYLSEKMDGTRCVWIPPTRGMKIRDVPFANREKDKREHVATGLWTRYGKVIHCPEWFTQGFPDYPLDGELWLGRGSFQRSRSIAAELEPDQLRWQGLRYRVFDAPRYKPLLDSGRINNGQWTKIFRLNDNLAALGIDESHSHYDTRLYFDAVYKLLQRDLKSTDYMCLHEQTLLPFSTDEALAIISTRLDEVCDAGGEGLILRHPSSAWVAERSEFLMKIKKLFDAEGTVVGYKSGEEGKDGKFRGKLGSLVLRWQRGMGSAFTEFNLSGFDDSERTLSPLAGLWAYDHPGELLPDSNSCPAFPLGSAVTFRYSELTDAGVPKNARYWRKA